MKWHAFKTTYVNKQNMCLVRPKVLWYQLSDHSGHIPHGCQSEHMSRSSSPWTSSPRLPPSRPSWPWAAPHRQPPPRRSPPGRERTQTDLWDAHQRIKQTCRKTDLTTVAPQIHVISCFLIMHWSNPSKTTAKICLKYQIGTCRECRYQVPGK